MISSKNQAPSPTNNCTYQPLPLCLSGVFWSTLWSTEQESPFYRRSLTLWYLHRQVADMCSVEEGIYHKLWCRHKSLPLNTKVYCRGFNFHPSWESMSISCMSRNLQRQKTLIVLFDKVYSTHTRTSSLLFLCHSENIFIKKKRRKRKKFRNLLEYRTSNLKRITTSDLHSLLLQEMHKRNV